MNSQQLKLLDTVIVTVDLPSEEVLAGDLGTIVEIYNAPSPAYEVEFVNPTGRNKSTIDSIARRNTPAVGDGCFDNTSGYVGWISRR